jgi:hypothetical protein
MRTFHEFIRAHEGDKLDELFGINLFGKSKPAPAPTPEETPAERYRRKIAQARAAGSTLTGNATHVGDEDQAGSDHEAKYLAGWRHGVTRSNKK